MTEELLGWLSGSNRFRSFAERYPDKIRKKVRTALDPEALRDVRAELQVAHRLLADRRFDLAFEAYGSGRIGPDFTVSFRSVRSFNLEVTRLRHAPRVTGEASPLLAKLRQLPPSVPNAVLFAIEGDAASALDVDALVRSLRARADAKDDAFFATRGLHDRKDFYERFLRLGGVVVWCERAIGDERAALWINRSSRIALPERATQAAVQCLRS